MHHLDIEERPHQAKHWFLRGLFLVEVEIGTVHVSGVSCLIEEPKFQRGVCVEQYHGGMRCYKTVAPVGSAELLGKAAVQFEFRNEIL